MIPTSALVSSYVENTPFRSGSLVVGQGWLTQGWLTHWRAIHIARNIRAVGFNGRRPMKQNITLALDREVLLAARVFAAQQGTSVSAMLAEELREKIGKDRRYEHSKQIALSMLEQPWSLGGLGINNREVLHDRTSLR